jgi:DNA-binding NtrC family response regulator
MAARILVVDDELVICRSCEKVFRKAGHDVSTALSGRQALDLLTRESFDVVFTDLKMMDVGGMEVLKAVKEHYPETIVVVITGYATIASAVETMRSGAFDYLPKPFTAAELMAVLERALERRHLSHVTNDEEDRPPHPAFPGLAGHSDKMHEVAALVRRVAPTDCTVLIVGESGTGKDLTAKEIHNHSKRRAERFVAIDIATLPSSLLESELFGHVKGAFTGAIADTPGVFARAEKGTIFLDEIGNLPLETQSRLLRVLQEKEYLPVGGTAVRKADVRLIFATNKNLKELVQSGLFREDLYYRLNVFPIKLPPLRERTEDIPDLVMHFLKKYSLANGRTPPGVDASALEAMMAHSWPGNVRELEHAVERLVILVDEDTILPTHVASALYGPAMQNMTTAPRTNEDLKERKRHIREVSVQEMEKLFVAEALSRNDWNVSRAARDVNMQRSNFQALMKKYRIRRPPYTV